MHGANKGGIVSERIDGQVRDLVISAVVMSTERFFPTPKWDVPIGVVAYRVPLGRFARVDVGGLYKV